MFVLSIVVAVIIGYLCKGQLSNLRFVQIKGITFIFASFIVEWIAKILLNQNMIELGNVSWSLHLFTYILLGIMIVKNWGKGSIKLIGIGTLLNALVIFSNNGIMPVGTWAMERLGIPEGATLQGMYLVMHDQMHFKILADILPIRIMNRGFILSIGDLFLIAGLMIIIIFGMKKETCRNYSSTGFPS